MTGVTFSSAVARLDWSEARSTAPIFGPKGASLLALPTGWTPPFALIPAETASPISSGAALSDLLDAADWRQVVELASADGRLIVRSSVIGESIWDRGTYVSIVVDLNPEDTLAERMNTAAREVVASANGKPVALVVQQHVDAASMGEFGNLQRISKTRDQWELSQTDRAGSPSRTRLNSQRDVAANPDGPISVRAGVTTERLFGSVAAWLNNELLRGKSQRLNCEWVTDNRAFYIVQVDEEDEDVWGVNPLQLRVAPSIRPPAASGQFLRLAEGEALKEWDKLKVLDELWEPGAQHRPTLFYVALQDLPASDAAGVRALADDFGTLIGLSGIVVRTSVRAGEEKVLNLPRTECLDPERAATWCLDKATELRGSEDGKKLAFVAHRFVASRASAWVRAQPDNPMVEIHALWGLPDALQYCPYDIWEVHVPTGVATDYPEYKSDMLVPKDDGGWAHARVKNEIARANSIGTSQARSLAKRSIAIAERLGRSCHIMWFVGCVDEDGQTFDLPWYWTEAHDTETNVDRTAYNIVTVASVADLEAFVGSVEPRQRQAISLKPLDLDLMRNNGFIESVGAAAAAAGVPVILWGSTLAHAYYQLRKQGCVVVAASQKERSRIRRTANLGKLVRDKIPGRIAQRQEHEVTKKIPPKLMQGFLLGKLLEEALEVREATNPAEKQEELADLYEVVRALARLEGLDLDQVSATAEQKRQKAGGFEEGLVLLQTGIAASDRSASNGGLGQLLGDQTAEDTIEMPFSFFGFMEFDQPRSILLDQFGIRLDVTLRADRIEIRIVRSSEQLGLPLEISAG